ncbi:MAG: tRNA uridine-5-carboxymethylaminomethyl(34) synthesis enzyme MnmG, partial [Desulfovibrio sp.]|nr:tRNA uridine-5-carboxymethylaminomethyl(34) synthesis enzyme MnmG [Desulfovibrio sp.]
SGEAQNIATADAADKQNSNGAASGASLPGGRTLAEALRRPELDLQGILNSLRACPPGPLADVGAFLGEEMSLAGMAACESVQIEIKYSGYLARQRELVARAARLESTVLPPDIDYAKVSGLSHEVTEKLDRVRPLSLGQAGRISGVTPAAIGCLEIHLHKLGLL